MTLLRDVQQRAYRAILLEEPGDLPLALAEPRRAFARIEVYRNNARETFRRALAATYPVVERMVGDACFRSLARTYMRDFPSRSGDLGCFGMEFPMLLDICYGDTEFAYLPDVAKLERALAEAGDAPDAAPLDLVRLAAVPPDHYAQLRFSLHPAARLLSSRFPVLSLWQAHRAADVASIDLRSGAEHVLIARDGDDIQAQRVAAETYAFVRSLADGETLADAVDAASALASAFDPAPTLAELVRRGVLVEVFFPIPAVHGGSSWQPQESSRY